MATVNRSYRKGGKYQVLPTSSEVSSGTVTAVVTTVPFSGAVALMNCAFYTSAGVVKNAVGSVVSYSSTSGTVTIANGGSFSMATGDSYIVDISFV